MLERTPSIPRSAARPDSSLLALALTGFLAATGCGDDSSGEPTSQPDGGATSASSAVGESSSGAAESNSTVAYDAGATGKTHDGTETAAAADAGARDSEATEDLTTSEPVFVDGGSGDAFVPVTNTDADQDGVSVEDGDCDDFNDTVYPGAPELALDGEDSDCDGEDAPAMNLVWSASETNNSVDALAAMDTDEDGAISLQEFDARCAQAAKLSVESNPGILQFHAACAGNNSCRGMVLQSWGELYEHSCRGVNYCSGWSCVETATDEGRAGLEALSAAHCTYCHSGTTEGGEFAFGVPVPHGEDTETYLDTFWSSRSDDYLRSIIAFGVSYTSSDGYRIANMPAAYHLLSRMEIDTLIGYLRTLPMTPYPLETPTGEGDGGSPMNMD